MVKEEEEEAVLEVEKVVMVEEGEVHVQTGEEEEEEVVVQKKNLWY